MNVLMISGDVAVLNPASAVYARLLLQSQQVDWLDVLVPARQGGAVALGERGMVRGISGNKITVSIKILFTWPRRRIDIVTAQDPFFLGLLGWVIARTRGALLQLQIHTDVYAPEFKSRNRAKVSIAHFLLHHTDRVRVVSQRIADSLVPLMLKAPVSVLPIYIDSSAIDAAVSGDLRSRYARFSHIVLVVSRLEPEKNIAAALVVMKNILAEIPSAGLFVAGDGSQKERLERQARDLGILQSVVFLGRRADVFSLYKAADVHLITSWYEGYGATIVEALRAGCAVVTPDVGVAREAGAIVAPREGLARAALETLRSGMSGHLLLPLLSKEEWATQWRHTL